MATNKPRITVTLDQEVYETIRALSSLQGVTMSGMVSDLLTMTNPVQQRVLQAIQKAQLMDAESKADMVSMLESGQTKLFSFTDIKGTLWVCYFVTSLNASIILRLTPTGKRP